MNLEVFLARWREATRPKQEAIWGERALTRCAKVWTAQNASAADRLVALRQALRILNSGAAVEGPNEEVVRRAPEFGVSLAKTSSGYFAEAGSFAGRAEMVGEVRPSLFDARPSQRQNYDKVTTDPWTKARVSDEWHLVPEQRTAIRAMLTCPPGGILAVSIPTGGGKSRIPLLPLLAEAKGATVTVVPTVALALDQVAKARQYLGERGVACLVGSVSAEARADVFRRLREGELRLLFLGPEMLVGSAYANLSQAVRTGWVTTLAIDEAHLVSQWGREFRPEYTLLGEVRKDWLQASGGALRTVLLSATWSKAFLLEAKRMFATGGQWRFIDAGALRCEHDIVAMTLPDEDARNKALWDLLRHAPRPAIIYVTRRKDAAELRKWLRSDECGLRRIEAFTGETSSASRDELIRRWNADDIDVMVATSAFGVGVDKPDVRVVVHACLPESVDRYYQEIGRAGRDGFAALAVLAPVKRRDSLDATRLAAHLSADIARERMDGLYLSSDSTHAGARILRKFKLDTMREGIRERASSEENRNWNKATLGWMHRLGLLKVLLGESAEGGECWWAEIEKPQMLSDSARSKGGPLERLLQYETNEHYNEARPGLEVLQRTTSERADACIQATFAEVYRLPVAGFTLCGRCPYCGYMTRPLSLNSHPCADVAWQSNLPSTPWRALMECENADFLKVVGQACDAGYGHILCSDGLRSEVGQVLTEHASKVPSSKPVFLSTIAELQSRVVSLEPVPTLVVLGVEDSDNNAARDLFHLNASPIQSEGPPVAFLLPKQFRFSRDASLARSLYVGPLVDADQYLRSKDGAR